MADPETKALYDEAAKAEGKPVFSLTVADFFNAPTVEQVDVSEYTGAVGDEIVILASDDFEVASVGVAITDADGNEIEGGEATETPEDSGRWVYAATTEVATGTTVRITVTASDRPGSVDAEETDVTL